ncbi:MAG: TolB family protein [Planctomycetota bacterium]|jgi:Tol biopolymer transport system component
MRRHLLLVVLVIPGFSALTRDAAAEPFKFRLTRLTSEPGEEYSPSLSPDAKVFLYVSKASGNWDIYRREVGGKTAVNLTKDCKDDDFQPAFSPDGRLIAFASKREGGGIFLMSPKGGSPRRLAKRGYDPAWSPDGREIVFATAPALLFKKLQKLFLLDTQTKKTSEILVRPGPDGDVYSVSPDDRWLYATVGRLESDIWMLTFE